MSEANVGSGAMSRSAQLDQVLSELVGQVPEIEAAAVVSFDGLAMASALPAGMDEDRVAAMSAALLSLGERAADGLGRGELSQVYIEGENGTVFLISADDEAVLVAVAARGAKTGLMLFEVRRAAASVADALRDEVLPAYEDEVLAPYEEEAPPPYDEAPAQYEEELLPPYEEAPLPAYDYYTSAEPTADVPDLQFVTKNGWSGQNGTAAETPSWS